HPLAEVSGGREARLVAPVVLLGVRRLRLLLADAGRAPPRRLACDLPSSFQYPGMLERKPSVDPSNALLGWPGGGRRPGDTTRGAWQPRHATACTSRRTLLHCRIRFTESHATWSARGRRPRI